MTDHDKNKTALISAPWPVYNRPSIQLGALKASLQHNFADLVVDSHHFYLNIAEKTGYRVYHEISEKSWLAEAVYAALLYPDKKKDIKPFFEEESSNCKAVKEIGFNTILTIVKKASDELIDKTDWDQYFYAGFSVCLCQLSSSLYFISRIKKKYPNLAIAVGGSLFSVLNPEAFFTVFSEIDFIINGEGELPLNHLTQQFIDKKKIDEFTSIPGLIIRGQSNKKDLGRGFTQTKNLDTLPVPDFTDYYEILDALPASKKFFPTLPMEMSRGCWWNHTSENGQKGCAFCNLNLQWRGYRAKSVQRVIKELDYLSSKYQGLSVNFMDNLIPFKKGIEIFKGITNLQKDFSLFCEIRANNSYKTLALMRKAGVRNVQIGIESLSSNLLYKMNKGTTAIENIESMKNCEALGISNNSNLIIHFPTSDEDDVAETLKAIEAADIFRPLKTVRFQLGLGSPVIKEGASFNIKSAFNHTHYKTLFPEEITSSVRFLNQEYRGDLGIQKKLWAPVKQRVKEWESSYNKCHETPAASPILTYRDGKDFLIIKKRRRDGEHNTHRISGTSREIYLFCEKNRSFEEIKNRFPKLSSQALFSFLSMMTEKKMIFEDDERYLSLAIKTA